MVLCILGNREVVYTDPQETGTFGCRFCGAKRLWFLVGKPEGLSAALLHGQLSLIVSWFKINIFGSALGSPKTSSTVPSKRKPSNELVLTRVRVSRFQTQFLWVHPLRFAYGSHPFSFCCSSSAWPVPSPFLCPCPVPAMDQQQFASVSPTLSG